MKNTATLLISCPDKKGIVASVANFLYQHNANILHADEHQDSELNLFFLRTEWDLADFKINKEEFNNLFSSLAQQFQMEWKVVYSDHKPKIALFVSQEGHCLADLLYRHKSGEFRSDISLVVSNHVHAKSIADFYAVPFHYIEVAKENKDHAEQTILSLLKQHTIELVVLARYMQILSALFIHSFNRPIINIHHSFLPAFVGAKPYHQAFKRGVKIIGATAHYVTADLDQGPIIEQDILRVSHRDTIEDLVKKGRDIEKMVLSRAVQWHTENKVLTYANKTVVFD